MGAMTFDRAKFDAIVSEKSPLTSAQFDTMLGNVTSDSKAIAWHILCLPSRDQQALWLTFRQWKRAFPDTVIAKVI